MHAISASSLVVSAFRLPVILGINYESKKEPTSARIVHSYGISHFFKGMVYHYFYVLYEVVVLKL